jgi:hypothetical protein
VVHADVDIARLAQTLYRERQDRELVFAVRELGFGDAPLRLERPRQVRIAVERQAVGRERDHLVERGTEAGHRLPRQAIDRARGEGGARSCAA